MRANTLLISMVSQTKPQSELSTPRPCPPRLAARTTAPPAYAPSTGRRTTRPLFWIRWATTSRSFTTRWSRSKPAAARTRKKRRSRRLDGTKRVTGLRDVDGLEESARGLREIFSCGRVCQRSGCRRIIVDNYLLLTKVKSKGDLSRTTVRAKEEVESR